MPLLDKTFIPWPRLRSATGCRLEPELTIINLEQSGWHLFNLNYDITVFPRIQGEVPVFIYIYIYVGDGETPEPSIETGEKPLIL